MKKLLITVIISCLTTAVSEAATYYVAKTGSNSNTCAQAQSQSTPKLTVTAGAACLVAGDTLYIKAGTYSETYQSIVLPTAASWAAATTISIYGSDVVTFSNSGNPFLTFSTAARYVIFNGFIFDGAAQLNRTGIATGSTSFLRFQNFELKNWHSTGTNRAQGIQGSGVGHEFLNCSVHDNGSATSGLEHGFYLSGSSNLIDHCTVYNNAGYGVQIYNSGHTDVNNNTVRNSTFYNNGATATMNTSGIHLSSGSGNRAYNNVVYGNFYGITIGSGATTTASLVYNNTVYGNSWGIGVESTSVNAVLKNNIVYQNTGSTIGNNGTGTVQSNNLTTDPKFVNASIKNFRLQTGSAAINAGTNLLSEGVTTDLAGSARPQGCCFTIGAYEYGSPVLPAPSNPIAPTNLVAGP